MKALLILLVSIFASASFAGVPNIGGGDTDLIKGKPFILNDYIAGEIVSVEPLCPLNAMCITDGTLLRIRFTLTNGCQSVKSVTANVLEDGIEVEAVRDVIGDICTLNMQYPVETVSLVNIYPPFVLVFKGTDVTFDIEKFTKIKAN